MLVFDRVDGLIWRERESVDLMKDDVIVIRGSGDDGRDGMDWGRWHKKGFALIAINAHRLIVCIDS